MNFNKGVHAIHVEVCLRKSELRLEIIEQKLMKPLTDYIANRSLQLNELMKVEGDGGAINPDLILTYVESFVVYSDELRRDKLLSPDDLAHLVFHMYSPQRRAMELEMLEDEGDGDGGAVPSSNHWILPSRIFVGLWENLIYDEELKEKLLKFSLSALTFSHHLVDQNIISCNRLILLHGPPGTGKTSLCKALAQKLAIRTRRAYRHTHLIEINSHSLFSKWFSESGKLVMRLFAKIREIVADSKNLVCVLIDEVESLAYARDCMSGQEPKDAMRVVNALLMQLDTIKEHPNVIILATSNLAESIDLAFLDRADIKQYIGLPGAAAIRRIYQSMLLELMRVGIVHKESLSLEDSHEGLLSSLSERSVGLSGRTLRKLPFLAHAIFTASTQFGEDDKISLGDFLDSMLAALEKHQNDQERMRK